MSNKSDGGGWPGTGWSAVELLRAELGLKSVIEHDLPHEAVGTLAGAEAGHQLATRLNEATDDTNNSASQSETTGVLRLRVSQLDNQCTLESVAAAASLRTDTERLQQAFDALPSGTRSLGIGPRPTIGPAF